MRLSLLHIQDLALRRTNKEGTILWMGGGINRQEKTQHEKPYHNHRNGEDGLHFSTAKSRKSKAHKGKTFVCHDHKALQYVKSAWNEKSGLIAQEYISGIGCGLFGMNFTHLLISNKFYYYIFSSKPYFKNHSQ